MSWAEFRIRLFAFKRMRNYELEMLRVHAYHTASGGIYAFDPKKFPNTLDKFWKIEKEVDKQDRERRLNLLKQKQIEATKKANNGKS